MRRLALFLVMIISLFTTGCWDMAEINERIFPYSVGIDFNQVDIEEGVFNITFSYPNILAIGSNATQDDTIHVISTKGSSIFQAVHNVTSRLHYPIYNKHLKVLVLSEEVARDPKSVKQLMDGLNRDFVINKMVRIVVTPESAEEVLLGALDYKRQQDIEGVLYGMLVNRQNSSMFVSRTLSDFIEDTDSTDVALVPVIYPGEDEIVIMGSGIFKNYGLIGYLDHKETRAIALINNNITEDGLDTEFNGNRLSILATSLRTKKELVDPEDLTIRLSVRIEGQIHEYTLPLEPGNQKGIEDQETIGAMEDALANEFKQDVLAAIEKLQDEFNADAIYLSEYLRKYHHPIWEQIKDNWNEIFPEVNIEVDIEVILRRRGLTK